MRSTTRAITGYSRSGKTWIAKPMAGNIPMIIGAWYHKAWLMPVGVMMVLFGWLRGALFPKTSPA